MADKYSIMSQEELLMEVERLSTEGAEAKASLEFLLNLSVPGHQDWEGYMMAVRNECRRGLAAVSGKRAQGGRDD
jgi:hypothetical protein